MFKKFLGVLCVLALCSFPALPQELPIAVPVSVTAVIEGGMFFTITPGIVTFDIPLPQSLVEEGGFVPSEVQTIYISYRLQDGRTAKLLCNSAPVVWESNPLKACAPNVMLKHTFTGDFSYVGMLPAVDVPQEVYRGSNTRDYVDATLLLEFFNSDLIGTNGIQEGTFTSTITYTLMDIPRV